jgi:hypothetical protein
MVGIVVIPVAVSIPLKEAEAAANAIISKFRELEWKEEELTKRIEDLEQEHPGDKGVWRQKRMPEVVGSNNPTRSIIFCEGTTALNWAHF